MSRRPVRHAPDAVTRAYRRTQAQAILVQRDDLDGLNLESFCRSWGLKEEEGRAMIRSEKARRAARHG